MTLIYKSTLLPWKSFNFVWAYFVITLHICLSKRCDWSCFLGMKAVVAKTSCTCVSLCLPPLQVEQPGRKGTFVLFNLSGLSYISLSHFLSLSLSLSIFQTWLVIVVIQISPVKGLTGLTTVSTKTVQARLSFAKGAMEPMVRTQPVTLLCVKHLENGQGLWTALVSFCGEEDISWILSWKLNLCF